jgi:hypothetical protein
MLGYPYRKKYRPEATKNEPWQTSGQQGLTALAQRGVQAIYYLYTRH